jgi:hypothetical protein
VLKIPENRALMIPKSPSKLRFSTEGVLYFLAFFLALAVRLFHLGAAPLNDFEANWALQAWDLVQKNNPALGPQPLYGILTAALFFIFQATNALARFIPAISGSLLVLLPATFHRFTAQSPRMRWAGLLMAFFLALDPGLVSLSRTAGGPMPAMSFGLLAVGLIYSRRTRLAGIACALALLSGPALLQGALGLGLTWLAARLLEQSGWLKPSVNAEGPLPPPIDWKQLLLFAVGTFLVVGTGLFLFPQGLGAFAAAIPGYIQGWLTPSDIPALRLPAALLLYEPLAVLFGLVGAFFAWFLSLGEEPADYLGRLLSIWAILALFAALILPNHQVFDAAWALIPLWVLAALTITALFFAQENELSLPAALGHAALTALFLILIGHNLLRLTSLSASPVLYAAVVGGILLMTLIVAILVAAGWSLRTSLTGLVIGICTVLLVLMISNTWKISILYPNGANEMWSVGPAAGQIDDLYSSVSEMSWWNKGSSNELDLVIVSPAPSLRWAFRDFPNTQYKDLVVSPETPSILITPADQQSLSLPVSYRGQDLVLSEKPAWPGALPANLLDWLAFRKAPTSQEKLILWVQNSLFPGGAASSQSELTTP